MSRIAFAGLGLAGLALAGVVALELSWIEGGGDPATGTAAAAVARWRPAPVVPTPPAPDRSGEWGATALRRPLFAADRRPVPEQRPPAATAAGGRELPRLTGVLVGPAGRTAIFAAAAEGARPVVVREGDVLGVFEVKTILAGEVTVTGPEGERVLRPSHDLRAPATRPSAVAPGAPSQPLAGVAPAAGQAAAPPPPPAGRGGNPPTGLLPAATPGGGAPVQLSPGFLSGGTPR